MRAETESILQKPQDYMDWDKLVMHCDAIKELSPLEREKAKRAFKLLKKEFGEDFLKTAFSERHPIVDSIVNLAPWTRKWIMWFAGSLKELNGQENYQGLLTRLKDSEKFPEALSVLEIASKLSRVGFAISIDPQVNISARTKVPDLKVRDEDNGEEFFLEVSVQKQSEKEKEAWQTAHRLFASLWRYVPFLHYCGRVHKVLADSHLGEILKKLEKVFEGSKKEGTFQELVIEDTIEIGVAPESDKAVLEKWAAERGLNVGEFSGPRYDVDEVWRTKGKIRNEQRQLPHECPNIIVISNNNLFLHTKDIRAVINELEEEVYRYPHLLAAVVRGGHIGKAEDTAIMKDQHAWIRKTTADLLVEQCMILLNQFCQFKIFASTITKIYNAFGSY